MSRRVDILAVLDGAVREDLNDEQIERLEAMQRFMRLGLDLLDAHAFGPTAISLRARMAREAERLGLFEVRGVSAAEEGSGT